MATLMMESAMRSSPRSVWAGIAQSQSFCDVRTVRLAYGTSTRILREQYQGVPEVHNVKTVFSIHNVMFQGCLLSRCWATLGLAGYSAALINWDDASSINFLWRARFATLIICSPLAHLYAREFADRAPRRGNGWYLPSPSYRAASWMVLILVRGHLQWSLYSTELSARHMEGKAECVVSCKRSLALR